LGACGVIRHGSMTMAQIEDRAQASFGNIR
jgi:hypothetical protein